MKCSSFDSQEVKLKKKVNKEHNILPVCFLCHQVPQEGIRSGFFLKGIFICNDCERDLVNSKPGDKDEYFLTIAKLKNIIFKDNPR